MPPHPNYNVECWIDLFSISNLKKSKKIFIQLDPDEYLHLNKALIERQNEFDYIFTFESEVLENCENAILFEYGTTWLKPEEYIFQDKKFSLSFVCNNKLHNPGHFIRHDIFDKQDHFKIPLNFFLSSMNPDKNDPFYKQKEVISKFNNPILGDSKTPLFESMFSICVENVKKDYYFSEKLIDCFLCKSIPVYYGCSNIEQYFNMEGIISFDTIEELIEKTSTLTTEFYESKYDIIEENYKKSLSYVDYSGRILDKINLLL